MPQVCDTAAGYKCTIGGCFINGTAPSPPPGSGRAAAAAALAGGNKHFAGQRCLRVCERALEPHELQHRWLRNRRKWKCQRGGRLRERRERRLDGGGALQSTRAVRNPPSIQGFIQNLNPDCRH